MLTQLRTSLIMLTLLTVVTGVLYPFAVTGIAHLLFSHEANGSLIVRDGKCIGSELIGQEFTAPRYFWGRLSATTPYPYNAAASGGSNFGPLHPGLQAAAESRIAALRAADREADESGPVPVDLITASGSGLDPHISPAAADRQVRRVAKARDLTVEVVRQVVRNHTEPRQFGVFGERRVNVLLLNLALDEMHTSTAVTSAGR